MTNVTNVTNVTIKTRYADIHLSLFFIAVFPLIIISGCLVQYLITLLSIILHEAAHIITAVSKGGRLTGIKVLPVGVIAEADTDNCSRRDLIAVYSSGPAANILLSAAGYILYISAPLKYDQLFFFSLANFYLAVFNLIPAIPLDGGRILQEILTGNVGLILAGRYLRYIALLLASFFLLLGIYQFFSGKINFSFFAIGLYIMFLFKKGKMEASLMNIKQLLYRRARLLKKGFYPARELAALKDVRLSAIIKAMDYDRFHFIYVLDADLKLLRIISENEVIECMMKQHCDMTFEELIKSMDS